MSTTTIELNEKTYRQLLGRTLPHVIRTEEECERLRKLSDEELIREGKAARFLCAPNQNFGKPPRNVFVVRLRLL